MAVQSSVYVDRVPSGRVGGVEAERERFRLRLRPPADQELDARVGRERAGDVTAEIAIAADDEHARYHEGFATMR